MNDIRLPLTPSELERSACYLLRQATLDTGEIDAQQVGLKQPSLASAGATLAALGLLPVGDQELRPLVATLEASVGGDGRLTSISGVRSTDWTSWAAGQILLGLMRRPRLLGDMSKASKLRSAMIADFFDEGSASWRFRTVSGDEPHPIFQIYPVLSLMRSLEVLDHSAEVESTLQATLTAAVFELDHAHEPVVKLCYLMTAVIVSGYLNGTDRSVYEKPLNELEASFMRSISSDEFPQSTLVSQGAQPLWHVSVDRQFQFLFTRVLWPIDHPINCWGILALERGYDEILGGWSSDSLPLHSSICSWATALGLMSSYLLSHDLSGHQDHDLTSYTKRLREVESMKQKYDVAISFSGNQRPIAETIARRLQGAGFSVFYDNDRRHELLGTDLAIYLQKVYFSEARYAVAVLTKDFLNSRWAGNFEWKAILARMVNQQPDYVLPYFVEEVEVPGLNPTIGYISATNADAREFADIVIAKLRM